jgi:hypothetical protein
MHWRVHILADTVPILSSLLQCSSEPSKTEVLGIYKKILIHTQKIWESHHLQEWIKSNAEAVTRKMLQNMGRNFRYVHENIMSWCEHIAENPISTILFS